MGTSWGFVLMTLLTLLVVGGDVYRVVWVLLLRLCIADVYTWSIAIQRGRVIHKYRGGYREGRGGQGRLQK